MGESAMNRLDPPVLLSLVYSSGRVKYLAKFSG